MERSYSLQKTPPASETSPIFHYDPTTAPQPDIFFYNVWVYATILYVFIF